MQQQDWDNRYRAEAFHGHAHHAPTGPELATFVSELTPIPSRTVDLGCGSGADAVALAGLGIEVIGVDTSAPALELASERARRSGVAVTWLEADALDLPTDDASVDLVTDRGHLHHVADADRSRYAAEVARVLRPGGVLLVLDLAAGGHHGHVHAHGTDRAGIESLVAQSMLTLRHEVQLEGGDDHHRRQWNLFVVDRT